MCGIFAVFGYNDTHTRDTLLKCSKKLRHRGPDWNGIFDSKNAILAHERLAIVDPTSGKQPLYSQNNDIVLAANGEIYNHIDLRKNLKKKYNFKTKSDCEILLALYEEEGVDFLEKLNGIFAFAIYDISNNEDNNEILSLQNLLKIL